MVRSCYVCGEKKDKEATDSQIRFFKMPSAKSPIYNQWTKTIKDLKNKPSDRLKKNVIICSRHFESSCFIVKNNTVQLKKGSLPTIRDPGDKASPSVGVARSQTSDDLEQDAASDDEMSESEQNSFTAHHSKKDHTLQNEEDSSDTSSDSLSPPTLQPLPEVNSDYEEDVEEPPDLQFFNINNDAGGVSFLTNMSEYDAVQTDHIGSVADILGADFFVEESMVQEIERSEASSKAEIIEVDGQTILSFASAEELEDYVSHCEPPRPLARAIDNFDKACQPTPSLTPSPCSSPFPSSQVSLPSDTTAPATGASQADASCGPNGRSPVPSHSEDSALPDEEVRDIMGTDKHDAVAAETHNREEESSPEIAGTVAGNPARPPADTEESSNALRYSESEDSMAGASESSEEQKIAAEPLAGSSVGKDAIKDVPGSSLRKVLPVLNADGTITPEIAAFAVSAISLSPQTAPADATVTPAQPQPQPVAPKRSTGTNRGRRSVPVAVSNRPGRKSEPSIFDKTAPTDETDEMFNPDMTVNETSFDDLVVLEEEYADEYDVPSKNGLEAAACGKLSCRLGCICTSLEEAGARRKQPPDHCSLPECMIECVCGYKRGKLTGRRSFVSLLKGNESFYSKINWTSERSRRERKVPERYSEYELETDAIKMPNPVRVSSGSRGNSRPASPTYRPSSYLNRQQQGRAARTQNQASSTPNTPTMSPKKKECFKLKISANEIKLLRWDSYVSLSKVYVAPDQEIMCMDHSTYSCPCITSNRRVIRIPSKFVSPSVRIGEESSPNSPAKSKTSQVKSLQPSGNSSRNVAKKHTHPIMRTANNKEKRGFEGEQLNEEAIPRPSAMSKMRKLLQDERFQLQKLIMQEKTRAFDDEIDLTVRQGQTVQLVAWIRFHSIYHAEKMHIRFLSRRSGPVILVMRPTEIVAADITCDIQEMKGNENAPEIVKELLDPCISPEETSRYAFLLCDGIKWELVGCLSLQAQPVQPLSSAMDSSLKKEEPSSVEEADLPLPDTAPNSPPKQMLDPTESDPEPMVSPGTQRRLDAMEERRRLLEEKLDKINSRLNFQPPKPSFKASKPKPSSAAWTQPPPVPSSSNVDDVVAIDSPIPSATTPRVPVIQSREQSENASLPIPSVLPDYFPTLFTRPTFMTDLSVPENRPDDYVASEQMVRFSRLVLQMQENYLKEFTNKAKKLLQAKQAESENQSPCSSPFPSETRRIPEMSLLKESSCFGTEDSTMDEQGMFQKIRIVLPQETPHNAPPSSSSHPLPSSFRPFASLGGIQRMQDINAIGGASVYAALKSQEVRGKGLPSNVFVRKLTPVSASLLSNQPGPNKNMTTCSLAGIVPTSTSSVLKVPVGVTLAPKPILPKITSINSMAFGEAPVITATSLPKPTIVKVDGQVVGGKPAAYPDAISIEVTPVQAPNSRPQLFNHRMKVVLDVMSEEHRMFCPSRTNMLLPLHNDDDEWSLVAVDAVPQTGLPVPGLQVIVPRTVLEKALSTASERQARVSFPLHVQAIPTNPVLKKGFGVYATPQLPRHAFLGPFPSNYLKSRSTLPVYIKLLAVTTDPATEAALRTITQESVVIELTPVSSSAAIDDSVVIEKVVSNPRQSSGTSKKKQEIGVLIEPADAPVSSNTADLSYREKPAKAVGSSSDSQDTPVEDPVFISTGVEAPSVDVEIVEDLPASHLRISKVESSQSRAIENDCSSEEGDLQIAEEPDKENEAEGASSSGEDSAEEENVDVKGIKWHDEDSRWLESVAYLNGNSQSNSPSVSDQFSQDLVIEPVEAGSRKNSRSAKYSSRKRNAGETVEDESVLPRRSPKRTRRPTEKARMFAEEMKANRSGNVSSPSSQAESRRQTSFSPPAPGKRSSFQRELHIIKEQERRGLLCKLFKDLDALIAPNSGPRSKIVILKHATNTLKGLEEQSKAMDNLYGVLKARRNTLLRQRFKLFNELTKDVKPIFKCLLDSTPLPERHLSVEAEIARNQNKNSARRANGSQHELCDDSEDIDIVIC